MIDIKKYTINKMRKEARQDHEENVAFSGSKNPSISEKRKNMSDNHECDNPKCGCHFYEIERRTVENGHDVVVYAHPVRANLETDEYY